MIAVESRAPTVFLSDAEMALAWSESEKIHGPLRAKGTRNAHGMTAEAATSDLEASGHACELALSLYLDREWSAVTRRSPDGGKALGPDVGDHLQVRSSDVPRKRHHLIVRARDLKEHGDVPFVLVIRQGRAFSIRGWAMCGEVGTIGRWWDGGRPGRPKAWFVPEDKLRPIRELSS